MSPESHRILRKIFSRNLFTQTRSQFSPAILLDLEINQKTSIRKASIFRFVFTMNGGLYCLKWIRRYIVSKGNTVNAHWCLFAIRVAHKQSCTLLGLVYGNISSIGSTSINQHTINPYRFCVCPLTRWFHDHQSQLVSISNVANITR